MSLQEIIISDLTIWIIILKGSPKLASPQFYRADTCQCKHEPLGKGQPGSALPVKRLSLHYNETQLSLVEVSAVGDVSVKLKVDSRELRECERRRSKAQSQLTMCASVPILTSHVHSRHLVPSMGKPL